jgi:hypothetical protein
MLVIKDGNKDPTTDGPLPLLRKRAIIEATFSAIQGNIQVSTLVDKIKITTYDLLLDVISFCDPQQKKLISHL